MQIKKKNKKNTDGKTNLYRSKDQLMIDSKCEWQRGQFAKKYMKRKEYIWIKRRTWTTELI